MSLRKTEIIDFVSINATDNMIVLSIADDEGWANEDKHIDLLEEKINTYLYYVDSNGIWADFPDCKGKKIKIDVILRKKIPTVGKEFLEHCKKSVLKYGILFEFYQYSGK